ncbi:MAG: hypothetical protein WKF35_00165 [Ferruginibacter sp.]
MSQIRLLAAIMFTDIFWYISLMVNDDCKASETLNINREIQNPHHRII